MNPLHSNQPRVVCVALNPALDDTIEVKQLRAGTVNRALRMQVDAGGKGINVASCLSDSGIRSDVTGQIGRENADRFETLFSAKGITNRCIYLEGLTRIGGRCHGGRHRCGTDCRHAAGGLRAPGHGVFSRQTQAGGPPPASTRHRAGAGPHGPDQFTQLIGHP